MKSKLFILLIGCILGIITNQIYNHYRHNSTPESPPLRLGNNKLINPLLACITEAESESPLLQNIKDQLQKLVETNLSQGNITNVGIYLQLNSANHISINPNEKFYPASLNKIPVMITAYKTTQTNPDFLNQTITFDSQTDFNQGQEITPQETITPGQTYTINEAITRMITDSDNNSFYALTQSLDSNLFRHTYSDLQIPIITDSQIVADYVTPEEFSFFFRVLYNATYLNNDFSQKALQLLTEVKYDQGLRANIPKDIPIAHKFGLLTNSQNGQPVSRELHDCGFIYLSSKPYLLCIMTKSQAPLPQIENFIKQISNLVYQEISSKS